MHIVRRTVPLGVAVAALLALGPALGIATEPAHPVTVMSYAVPTDTGSGHHGDGGGHHKRRHSDQQMGGDDAHAHGRDADRH